MKALVGAFNQEKALVGAFSVIVQPVVEPMDQFAALVLGCAGDLHPAEHRQVAGGGAGGAGDGQGGEGHARQAAHQEVPRAGQGATEITAFSFICSS